MSGLLFPSSSTPQVVTELQRGAVLGLLRLEIEAMLLRLEIEWMRRKPEIEILEAEDEPAAWVVRVNPAVWGSGRAASTAGLHPRRRIFRLRAGNAELRARASLPSAPETLLAIARELVATLEDELGVTAQDAA